MKYLSAMKHLDFVIGNTSSGIIEAASFQKPVINIGCRQSGRLQSGNVIDSTVEELTKSIDRALSEDFLERLKKKKNIYGDGKTASKIIDLLKSQKISVIKKFNNLVEG